MGTESCFRFVKVASFNDFPLFSVGHNLAIQITYVYKSITSAISLGNSI
jgi:hypothetical protein